MKTESNEQYIEDMKQDFYDGDANKKEEVIECLRAEGFEEEAQKLEDRVAEDNLEYPEDTYTAFKDSQLPPLQNLNA